MGYELRVRLVNLLIMQVTDMNPEEAFIAERKPDWTRNDIFQHLPFPLAPAVAFLFGGYDTWVPILVGVMERFTRMGIVGRTVTIWLFLQSFRLLAYLLRKTSVKKAKVIGFNLLTVFAMLVGVGLAGGFLFSGIEWWRAAPVIRKVVKKAVGEEDDDEDEEL